MSEFNAEDYVNGMDDVDKLANQEKVEQTDHTSPAEQVEETEKASEPSQEDSQEQSQDASEDSLTPLGKAKAEAAEYLEALQRERAAFVNFRNRVSKEQDRYREHGVVDVLTALLPALDDIDRIRANSQMDDSFKAVAAKIDKTFEKFGVEKFGEAGEDFDPKHHEGILRKPDADASHEKVDTVVEAGYKRSDRSIRAARGVVAVPQDNE